MKSNAKYTALEILRFAGVENPEEVFGNMIVTIAGIQGIIRPDHRITIQSGIKEIEVIVGVEKYVVKTTEDSEERELSDGIIEQNNASSTLSDQENTESPEETK